METNKQFDVFLIKKNNKGKIRTASMLVND